MNCLTCCGVFVLIAALGLGAFLGPAKLKNMPYQVQQGWGALKTLYDIPTEELDAFVTSFKVFEREDQDFYQNSTADYQSIKDYYRVLNRLCSLGNVEKMYIPPVMDPSLGVFENQLLYEHGFADELNTGSGKKLLEMGCGRGRIAHTVASRTGSHITAFNIDPTQLAIARKYATETGLLDKQLNFVELNMNDKFPWPDNSFDGFYQVQAMTYAKNLTGVFCEISRVLKSGAKMSVLDGVAKDNYNGSDSHHRRLLARTREVTGFGHVTHHEVWKKAVEDCGMRVLTNKELSVGGKQGPLILQETKYFHFVMYFVNFLTTCKILPYHFSILLERFNRHIEAFIEMDDKELLTTSWHIMAQKI
mmetsp:Transcript_12897/g.22281  ORF Transcript_12897/g.22281 Transcript_12897/m.22281 type:complete len:362 (+) Transcript_12897:112-1197(+)